MTVSSLSSSRWRSLAKWLLILLVFFFVASVLALKLIERSPDQLKIGFESYLTQMTGYPAEIGTLKQVRFFPNVIMDMSDIRFWPLDNPDGTAIGIKALTIKMPLWSAMIGLPRFSNLSVEGIAVTKDVTGIAPLSVTRIGPNEAHDSLDLEGSVGAVKLEAAMPLQPIGSDQYRLQRPPYRMAGEIKGRRSEGNVFLDVNTDGYGATATFSTYQANELRPVQLLLERLLKGHKDGILPVQLHIEALLDKVGGRSGPYVVPALALENGNLQPLECFYNNQGRTQVDTHPCAAYFKEPDTSKVP